MQLVVDTNIAIAALVKNAVTRQLIFDNRLELFAPEHMIEELEGHKDEIAEKAKIEKMELSKLTASLLLNIRLVPSAHFSGYLKEALKISPDKEDSPFFALALSKNIPIWSNERNLRVRQKFIKVYTTSELFRLLGEMQSF